MRKGPLLLLVVVVWPLLPVEEKPKFSKGLQWLEKIFWGKERGQLASRDTCRLQVAFLLINFTNFSFS